MNGLNARGARRYRSGSWLRCLHPRPDAETALLAFPHAGGSATFFRTWGESLPDTVELTAVQYPGRLDRLKEPCIDDVHALADAVDAALREEAWPGDGRRVALLGHSMGAIVAFETALRLEARNVRLAATFLSSHPGPGRPLRNYPADFTDQTLIGELKRLGATPSAVIEGADVREAVLVGLRSDYRAVGGYRPSQHRLTTPVVGLVGADDCDVTPDDMRSWSQATTGPMTLRVFAGDHFYLEPQRDAVLEAVMAYLGDTEPMRQIPGRR